ncbi:hypothetical protein EV360DRAFT_72293, partial [Lentinula raphanica]
MTERGSEDSRATKTSRTRVEQIKGGTTLRLTKQSQGFKTNLVSSFKATKRGVMGLAGRVTAASNPLDPSLVVSVVLPQCLPGGPVALRNEVVVEEMKSEKEEEAWEKAGPGERRVKIASGSHWQMHVINSDSEEETCILPKLDNDSLGLSDAPSSMFKLSLVSNNSDNDDENNKKKQCPSMILAPTIATTKKGPKKKTHKQISSTTDGSDS